MLSAAQQKVWPLRACMVPERREADGPVSLSAALHAALLPCQFVDQSGLLLPHSALLSQDTLTRLQLVITSPLRKIPGFLSQVTWSGIPFQSHKACYLLRRIDECPGNPDVACICITWAFISYPEGNCRGHEGCGLYAKAEQRQRRTHASGGHPHAAHAAGAHADAMQCAATWPFTCPLGRRIA